MVALVKKRGYADSRYQKRKENIRSKEQSGIIIFPSASKYGAIESYHTRQLFVLRTLEPWTRLLHQCGLQKN